MWRWRVELGEVTVRSRKGRAQRSPIFLASAKPRLGRELHRLSLGIRHRVSHGRRAEARVTKGAVSDQRRLTGLSLYRLRSLVQVRTGGDIFTTALQPTSNFGNQTEVRCRGSHEGLPPVPTGGAAFGRVRRETPLVVTCTAPASSRVSCIGS